MRVVFVKKYIKKENDPMIKDRRKTVIYHQWNPKGRYDYELNENEAKRLIKQGLCLEVEGSSEETINKFKEKKQRHRDKRDRNKREGIKQELREIADAIAHPERGVSLTGNNE